MAVALAGARPRAEKRRRSLSKKSQMLTILFDGIAYGMLLFILAVGLAVTMGLMNFINLAHGAFAMAGGYGHRVEDTVQAQVNTFAVAVSYWRRWQNRPR